jgi:hypothetical protein
MMFRHQLNAISSVAFCHWIHKFVSFEMEQPAWSGFVVRKGEEISWVTAIPHTIHFSLEFHGNKISFIDISSKVWDGFDSEGWLWMRRKECFEEFDGKLIYF